MFGIVGCDNDVTEDELDFNVANWLKGVNIRGKNLLEKYEYDFNLLN